MSFQVRVADGDIAFACAANESILDAAERGMVAVFRLEPVRTAAAPV